MRNFQTFIACATLLSCTWSHAALITQLPVGDATPNSDVLVGDLFLDAATTGGGDTNNATGVQSTIRTLDLNGTAGAPGVAGSVSIQGFVFATGNNLTAPAAAELTFTFTYLGLDGAVGGMDDVVIGTTEPVVFNDGLGNAQGFEGAGRYYVNFETVPTAMIDGLNENFLISILPTDGSIRFKTTGSGAQPLSAAKFSVSGTFAAVPEPSAMLLCGAFSSIAALMRRR
jgi:hypothetical protein